MAALSELLRVATLTAVARARARAAAAGNTDGNDDVTLDAKDIEAVALQLMSDFT